jgi:hypothetical protein
MGERFLQVLVSKTEGKGLLVRHRRRRENNTKIVLQGEEWGRGLKLSASRQGQVLCACECDEGYSGSIKDRNILTT